jgi:hypothetical protein
MKTLLAADQQRRQSVSLAAVLYSIFVFLR